MHILIIEDYFNNNITIILNINYERISNPRKKNTEKSYVFTCIYMCMNT